jgi:hypothetical protein
VAVEVDVIAVNHLQAVQAVEQVLTLVQFLEV